MSGKDHIQDCTNCNESYCTSCSDAELNHDFCSQDCEDEYYIDDDYVGDDDEEI